LRKTFDFANFEQAQHFVQRVGKFCKEHDHHPEWHVVNGGKSVAANLTSHFAGNKATLLDFQLAEAMNKAYKITLKEHNMFPYISEKTWASFKIWFTVFLFG
jgi:pterin-4a-carbinolamine dehydratase